jgi:hypothetical protein
MTVRQDLTAADRSTFPVGQRVRYQPGSGVYGFEDCLEPDGRLSGVVRGHTPTRVQVTLTLAKRGGLRLARAVNAASLIREPA